MNELLRWHDERFLSFLQETYYRWPLLSGFIACLLLVALPIHRRSSQIVIAATAFSVLLTVCVYGALHEAPVLACVTVFAAIISGARGLAWRMRRSSASTSASGLWSWIRPNGQWTAGLIRDYLRVDPRGTYWLDVARASRGITADRSPHERQAALFPVFEIPLWRARIWRQAVFPLAEFYIRWTPRLPRYWHYEHHDLDLGETDVQAVLCEEIAQQSRWMAEAEAGQSFEDYLARTVDAKQHQQALLRAGRYGRKACLLQEAWLESRSFLGRFEEGDHRLCQIADSLTELWRFRRRNDPLWSDEFLREEQKTADAGPPDQEAFSHPAKNASSPVTEDLVEAPESQSGDSDEDLGFEDIELQMASENEPAFDADDSPEDASSSDDVLDSSIAATAESEERTVALLAPPIRSSKMNGTSSAPRATLPVLTNRETERIRDLRMACEVLEGFLAFEPLEDWEQSLRSARRLFDRPARWPAATRLLMLYSLRADWRTDRQERVKAETIAWMFQWVRSLLGQDELVRTVKHLFFDLLIDWHACRGGYSQIRELFGQTEPRGGRQWELLGIAEAHIASQVQDRPSLRDTLIRDATAALFRARVTGFWTQRYAGLLLGTTEPAETIRLLQAHTVEFGRKELDRMVARSTASKPVIPAPDVPVDVVLEMEAPRSAAPGWFNARRNRSDTPESPPPAKKPEPSTPVPVKRSKAEPSKPAASDNTRAALPDLWLLDVKSRRRIHCKKYPVCFGSSETNQIQHAKLEPQHCAITCVDGRLRLVPAAKSVNIKVNGDEVTKPVRLKEGDVLQIGPIRMQVESL